MKLLGGMKLNEAYQILPLDIPEANDNRIVNEGTPSYEVVKQKYKQLALEKHPDRPGGDVESFQKLNEAYKTITGQIADDILQDENSIEYNIESILKDFISFFEFGMGYVYDKTMMEKILQKLKLFDDETCIQFNDLFENGDILIEMFTTPSDIYLSYLQEGLNYILEVDDETLIKNLKIYLEQGEYYKQIWSESIEPNMKIVDCFSPEADVKAILIDNSNKEGESIDIEDEDITVLDGEIYENEQSSNIYKIEGIQYLSDKDIEELDKIKELLENNPDSEEVKKYFELPTTTTPDLEENYQKIVDIFSQLFDSLFF
jgi:hypothetical protein